MAQRNKPEHSGPLMVKGRIEGKVVSKANSRRVTRSGLFIKSADALAFEQTAWQQIPHDLTPIEGDVLFMATVYYANYRPDLDESLVLDVLQQQKNKAGQVWFNGVYVNDRQVKTKIIRHAIDKENPRIEFTVMQLTDVLIKKLDILVNDVKTTYDN
jgi:hypothetical protein